MMTMTVRMRTKRKWRCYRVREWKGPICVRVTNIPVGRAVVTTPLATATATVCPLRRLLSAPKSTAKPAPTAAAPKSTAKPAPKAATPVKIYREIRSEGCCPKFYREARSEGYCPRIRLEEDIRKKGNEESEEAANYL
jgi:hypothetical protein